MNLLYCAAYVALIGILSNPVAALFPRSWFDPDKFPFRSFPWEQEGKIYHKLHIRAWKDRVPDMSKVLKNLVRKEIPSKPTAESLDLLARETCVAEFVHAALILLSLGVVKIWPGPGGWICWLLCILGNLPFMIIQRYNRPRLVRSRDRLRQTSK